MKRKRNITFEFLQHCSRASNPLTLGAFGAFEFFDSLYSLEILESWFLQACIFPQYYLKTLSRRRIPACITWNRVTSTQKPMLWQYTTKQLVHRKANIQWQKLAYQGGQELVVHEVQTCNVECSIKIPVIYLFSLFFCCT